MTEPVLQLLSLGAGVQSTTLMLMSAAGDLPKLDGAIFADTGWEPEAVYAHLDRLEREVAEPAGIPIYRVSNGNIRTDALSPGHRFASLPAYVTNLDGTQGMARRQCTSEYKLIPIKRQVRALLGYPHPTPVPKGVYVAQWIGISSDEWHRAKGSDVKYARNEFPLLEAKISRQDCLRYLRAVEFGETPKSACVGCPFHGNRLWREMRNERPKEWADAVEFDAALRRGRGGGRGFKGEMYLHRSRVPLAEAPIDKVTSGEWKGRQVDLLDMLADDEAELQGCSPFACRADGQEEPS